MQLTISGHNRAAQHHALAAKAITAYDADSVNRRTAHEHAARAHHYAATGKGPASYAIDASRRAGVDPAIFT